MLPAGLLSPPACGTCVHGCTQQTQVGGAIQTSTARWGEPAPEAVRFARHMHVHSRLSPRTAVTAVADRIRAGAFPRSAWLGSTAEEAGEGEGGGAPDQAPAHHHPLAPAKQYAANIGSVVRALTRSRAAGRLLHEPEWAAYREAVASGRCALASDLFQSVFCRASRT